jgi:hypothetical protein
MCGHLHFINSTYEEADDSNRVIVINVFVSLTEGGAE